MRESMVILFAVVVGLMFTGTVLAGEAAPQKVIDLANTELVKVGVDSVIVAAVKAQNGTGQSLDDIKAMDQKWRATAGIVDYMRALMDSACGQHLRKLQDSQAYYAEIFVMDNQGANVAMTDKTSDYWQGDEAKFKESFKGGSGALHIGEVEFDDSTQAYLVQVSVPVKDGGQVIGAITFGIDVDQIQ